MYDKLGGPFIGDKTVMDSYKDGLVGEVVSLTESSFCKVLLDRNYMYTKT